MKADDRDWFFLELPVPPATAPTDHHLAFAAIAGFMSAVALHRPNDGELPQALKAAIRAYAARWEPDLKLPE